MKYNNLPGTSLKVSLLSLGTMTFGAQTNEPDSLAILDYAYEHGVNFWDTANVYNQGESERIVGKALKGRRDEVILATKVFGEMGKGLNNKGLSRRNILSAVDASLKRLDTDYIDLYYMHRPDYETKFEETMETMSSLVTAGKIRYIGVSNFAAWQVADMLAICDKRNYIAPVISQNVYNLITRSVETEMLPFLQAHDMGMAVYNPIAGGLLTGKHKPGKPTGDTRFAINNIYYNRYWLKENFTAVDELTKIAEQHGMNILQLAMKWCATRPGVTSVISGVSKLSQIKQNIASLEGAELSSEVIEDCNAVWRTLAGPSFGYNR